jgi:hypothetical protein
MHAEHLTVVLPVAALLIGSLADIPRLFPKWPSIVMNTLLMAIFVLSARVLYSTAKTQTPINRCHPKLSRVFSDTLNSMDPKMSIYSKSESSILHWYQYYLANGVLPDINDSGITSTLCNRFRACPEYSDIRALDIFFYLRLKDEHKTALCVDRVNDRFNLNEPSCAKMLRSLILDLIREAGYRNIFLCHGNEKPKSNNYHLYPLNERVLRIIDTLERERVISVEPGKARFVYGTCDILHFELADKPGSTINPAAQSLNKRLKQK